jgi:hypothetical protein
MEINGDKLPGFTAEASIHMSGDYKINVGAKVNNGRIRVIPASDPCEAAIRCCFFNENQWCCGLANRWCGYHNLSTP